MALDDFIVNSDYPMDMVVFAAEGQVTGTDAFTVRHNLPFTPLPFGVWSLDGGKTWQPITGVNDRPNNPFADIYATPTSIVSRIQLNSASSNGLIRVFGLQPANVSGDATPPTYQISNYMLNTDFNYSKLVASVVWTLSTTSKTTLVSHNLGYIPEVAAWTESSSGSISPLVNGAPNSTAGNVNLIATTSTVDVECPGGPGGLAAISKLHVRVYGGKNG